MCEICKQNPCCPACPNFEDTPILFCDKCETGIFADDIYYEICGGIFCEDCTNNGKRKADRDNSYNSGAPVISYGDKWED